MRLGALVLAGGRSSRMGQPKESLPFAGDTLLGHCCRQLGTSCDPVLVLTRDAAQPLPPLPATVERLADTEADPGPLRALLQAMDHLAAHSGFTPTDAVLLTGCDMPFWSQAAIHGLRRALGEDDLVMPRHDGVLQTLAALYRLRLRPAIAALLAQGQRTPKALLSGSGRRELDDAGMRQFDPDLLFLRNINTPADYDAALALRRQRG